MGCDFWTKVTFVKDMVWARPIVRNQRRTHFRARRGVCLLRFRWGIDRKRFKLRHMKGKSLPKPNFDEGGQCRFLTTHVVMQR